LRFPRHGRGFWYGLAVDLLAPGLALASRCRFGGTGQLPHQGGVLVAGNHLSYADAPVLTTFCLAAGRVPRFFAKAALWQVPPVSWVMASGRHIPVPRGKVSALEAYRNAVRSVREGECVVVFPEGTFTERVDGWPMEGKTGLARIALTTGTPVVPVACWGTQHLLPVGSRWPRIAPRPRIEVVAGPEVELADLACEKPTANQLREATERIMTAITTQLADARGQQPPSGAARA
jgi:1-acyl-sn-glycerol-3-phosphate acyltransferase